MTPEELLDCILFESTGRPPTGPASRTTIAHLGEIRVDEIKRPYWQYDTRAAIVLVADGRDLVYRSARVEVDERSRVLEHVIALDPYTRTEIDLSSSILAAREGPHLLAVLDLLARFELGAADARLAAVTPSAANGERAARTVRRWSLQGTSGGWREVTATLRLWIDASHWRCERAVIGVQGEDGIALT